MARLGRSFPNRPHLSRPLASAPSVTANAGLAAAAGTALAPVPAVIPAAGLASGSGTALQPGVGSHRRCRPRHGKLDRLGPCSGRGARGGTRCGHGDRAAARRRRRRIRRPCNWRGHGTPAGPGGQCPCGAGCRSRERPAACSSGRCPRRTRDRSRERAPARGADLGQHDGERGASYGCRLRPGARAGRHPRCGYSGCRRYGTGAAGRRGACCGRGYRSRGIRAACADHHASRRAGSGDGDRASAGPRRHRARGSRCRDWRGAEPDRQHIRQHDRERGTGNRLGRGPAACARRPAWRGTRGRDRDITSPGPRHRGIPGPGHRVRVRSHAGRVGDGLRRAGHRIGNSTAACRRHPGHRRRGLATAAGTAQQPGLSVVVMAGLATGTGVALQATGPGITTAILVTVVTARQQWAVTSARQLWSAPYARN